jgi:transposase InsO family protein
MAWTQSHGIQHILIEPGRPMQNGYIEQIEAEVATRFMFFAPLVTVDKRWIQRCCNTAAH